MTTRIPDHENLLQPIQPESPAGASLRYDPVYDQIAEARRQEAALSQGVWKRATHQADWQLVEELATAALAERSKDLQIAIWLTESWLHLYGLPGFAAGCGLIKDLHDLYLLPLFPSPEITAGADGTVPLPLESSDAAVERRLNLLQWLNEKLSISIKLLPLTAPDENSGVPAISLADVEAAQHNHHAARRQGKPTDAVPLDAGLPRSLQLTPPELVTQMWDDLHQAVEAVDLLGSALDHYYGPANGGLLRIRGVLNDMALAIAPFVPPSFEPEPHDFESVLHNLEGKTMPEHDPSSDSANDHSSTVELSGAGDRGVFSDSVSSIHGRAQAYAQLGQIAAYLRYIEPHSPVPYLIERAIRWGSMSIAELMTELAQDPDRLKDLLYLLQMDRGGDVSNT